MQETPTISSVLQPLFRKICCPSSASQVIQGMMTKGQPFVQEENNPQLPAFFFFLDTEATLSYLSVNSSDLFFFFN